MKRSAFAKDLRELHKKDSNTGSYDTVFDEFMDTCEEVQKADSITQKQMLTYSKLFQMNFTNGSLRIQDFYGYCGTLFDSIQICKRKRTWQKEEKIAVYRVYG